jgi:hypothetical protein
VKCLAQRWSVVSPETCVTANNEFANQNNPEAYTLRIVISGLSYPFIAAMLVLFLHSFQSRFCLAAAVDGPMNLIDSLCGGETQLKTKSFRSENG